MNIHCLSLNHIILQFRRGKNDFIIIILIASRICEMFFGVESKDLKYITGRYGFVFSDTFLKSWLKADFLCKWSMRASDYMSEFYPILSTPRLTDRADFYITRNKRTNCELEKKWAHLYFTSMCWPPEWC